MSKYEKLWKYIVKENKDDLSLGYDDIKAIIGFEVDHSLLTFKKELIQLGFEVGKISMKNKVINFKKIN